MMDTMEELDGILTFEALAMAPEELDPYVLSFYPGAMEDGFVECYALCVMRREEGVLLAIPTGVLPQEFLDAANSEDGNGVFGPSCMIKVPSVILDNGVASPTGEMVSVVLIDCTKEVVDHLHVPGIVDELDYGFAEDQPYALPAPDDLVVKATGWISVASHQRVGYYSAESAEETPAPVLEADTKKKAEPKKQKPGAGLPTGNAKPGPRPKRATTASLAASLDSLMVAIPTLTTQVQALQDRQVKFEERLAGAPLTTRSQLTQPLSSLLQNPPRTSFDQVAKNMTPPPRTAASPALGILAPLTEKPMMLKELEGEKQEVLAGDQGSLAQAVLAQSQALTTLVSQIASAGSDPMADLTGTGTSSGSRGAQGRARLQAELALQKGTFFMSVLQSMARRMSPTSSVELTPQEMLSRGISGTRYVERFGGYGRMKEWGQLQYQVMTALDYLMDENYSAAKDTVALLAVTLEQGVLDNGRLEIASLLCLQEDVPSGVFMNRQISATSRSRSFAPLADQRWITCALAYLKEMDVIAAKRQEFAWGPQKISGGVLGDADPKPKPKPAPKRKGKSKGASPADEEGA